MPPFCRRRFLSSAPAATRLRILSCRRSRSSFACFRMLPARLPASGAPHPLWECEMPDVWGAYHSPFFSWAGADFRFCMSDCQSGSRYRFCGDADSPLGAGVFFLRPGNFFFCQAFIFASTGRMFIARTTVGGRMRVDITRAQRKVCAQFVYTAR